MMVIHLPISSNIKSKFTKFVLLNLQSRWIREKNMKKVKSSKYRNIVNKKSSYIWIIYYLRWDVTLFVHENILSDQKLSNIHNGLEMG